MKNNKHMVYTKEHDDFFKEFVHGHSLQEISDEFYNRFNIRLSDRQIDSHNHQLGLACGTHGGRFKKGHAPINKGKKREEFMPKEAIEKCKKTQFKKGNRPPNYTPIGTIVKKSYDGHKHQTYWFIKIRDGHQQRNYVLLHRYVWEMVNGEIPKDKCIIFLNGDVNDCRLENLEMVNRKELRILNSHYDNQGNSDIGRININMIRLDQAIKERLKGDKNE